tara:strand:- start:3746 stop:5824 length:2079 start_codon:yes stop_codon:yes gene_type:complete
MGLLRQLSKSISLRKVSDSTSDGGTATATSLRKEASRLLHRGETDSALEVIARGLHAASALLLDENEDAHQDDTANELNLIHLHAYAGKCHWKHFDYKEACSHFIASLDVAGNAGPDGFPDVFDYTFFKNMGESCYQVGKHEECVFAHEFGLQLLDEKTRRRLNDVKVTKKKKKYRKSPSFEEEPPDELITPHELKKGSSKVHHQLAVSLRHLRDFEKALDHFSLVKKPLEIALGAGDILCEMERCFRELNLPNEADACLERAAKEAPAALPPNVAKIASFRYEYLGGDHKQCIEELERCLAMAAKTAKLARKKSKLLKSQAVNSNQPTSATITATSPSKDQGKHESPMDTDGNPYDPSALDLLREAAVRVLLGKAHRAVGNFEAAEKYLTSACAKAPRDPKPWLALSALYRETDRDDLAMRALRQVASLGEPVVTEEELLERKIALEKEDKRQALLRKSSNLSSGSSGSNSNAFKNAVGRLSLTDTLKPGDSLANALTSSPSLKTLNSQKSGRLRQNLVRAAEQAELDKELAIEAEQKRLEKVKGKGSFSLKYKKANDFVEPNLLKARNKALAGMASIFEKHGQTGRAMEVYATMDQSDARVVKRQEEILVEAALKLQRVFRGKKAREEFEKKRRTRNVRRVYGSAFRGGSTSSDGFGSVSVYSNDSTLARACSQMFKGSRNMTPLGGSFF